MFAALKDGSYIEQKQPSISKVEETKAPIVAKEEKKIEEPKVY